ncbi:hypothetical protein [Arthrobacter crystallopoietes]|uniref:Uncharacterized protein n=1 Tax=Crystallibacter crystallopoietes TaxID=37928 RepID=A0A1H1ADL4_9MICC|nr:hypothetical protein [Arthrobacter crystallopoietes]AUI51573.1 hypothetical protein AC20117_12955 [Arthrobacter crystallopoietes]SDQ37661.1 hypothetical protein SAMN04489742_0873 [Arthrobacter crystallopoietes]
MTSEESEKSDQSEDSKLHPHEPQPAAETGSGQEEPLEKAAGPDSENVDGSAEADNAKEGGYGY